MPRIKTTEKLKVDTKMAEKVINSMFSDMLLDPVASETVVIGEQSGIVLSLTVSSSGSKHPQSYSLANKFVGV